MKRLLSLLLVMGMVGCGGGDEGPPAGEAALPATPSNSQVKVDESPAQAAEAKAVAALEQLGVKIERNSEGAVVGIINFGTKITDVGLVHLKELTNLKTLWLPTQITDTGLVHISELTNLEEVNLELTHVTDAGLVHLKGLTNLEHLNLQRTKITDAGLSHLSELTKLSTLQLYGSKASDAGLVHLEEMTNLQELWLGAPQGSDQITDAGLVHLKGLTKLTTLSLNTTQITDAGLVHLKGLTNLESLALASYTQITDDAITELKQALPNLQIEK